MPSLLTYCTNIHPGETWDEIFANLSAYTLAVRDAVSPGQPFPIGLRLSNRAALDLGAEASRWFQAWCSDHGCFVATLNGFPYGQFHGRPVKDAVYLPDWRYPQRLDYSKRLADLLATWLPPGRRGSISTVPLGFRGHVAEDDLPGLRGNLLEALEHLDSIAQRTGREILLALEPEPGCLLETVPDVVRCFEDLRLPRNLRRHLGVCFDTCHQAVQFESPRQALGLLRQAEIEIGHVQVSSALRLEGGDLSPMERFCEPCYLHQTVGRREDGSLVRYDDLPQALRASEPGVTEWRIHFHVPVFAASLGDCSTTRFFLEEILPAFDPDLPLEVETYTWAVLPAELQTETVTGSIVREIEWVRSGRER